MGFFSSIQAKAAAISASVYSVYRIASVLPGRIEAFNEGNYAEALLGKKWARILNPGAYDSESGITGDYAVGEAVMDHAEQDGALSDMTDVRRADLAAETDVLLSVESGEIYTSDISYGG